MPVMDGYTLSETIRKEEDTSAHMPIIALTANALQGERARAKACGIDEYLTKPLQLAVFGDALKRWMASSDIQVNDAEYHYIDEESVNLKDNNDSAASNMVDISVLTNLVGEDEEVVVDFLESYLDSLGTLSESIEEGVKGNDKEYVKSIAHRLKSTSRSVGALVLGDHCQALEDVCSNEDWDSVLVVKQQFGQCAELVKNEIASIVAAYRGK